MSSQRSSSERKHRSQNVASDLEHFLNGPPNQGSTSTHMALLLRVLPSKLPQTGKILACVSLIVSCEKERKTPGLLLAQYLSPSFSEKLCYKRSILEKLLFFSWPRSFLCYMRRPPSRQCKTEMQQGSPILFFVIRGDPLSLMPQRPTIWSFFMKKKLVRRFTGMERSIMIWRWKADRFFPAIVPCLLARFNSLDLRLESFYAAFFAEQKHRFLVSSGSRFELQTLEHLIKASLCVFCCARAGGLWLRSHAFWGQQDLPRVGFRSRRVDSNLKT